MVRHGAKGNQSSSDGFVPEDKSPMILFGISDSVDKLLNIIFSITMCPNTKAFFGTTTPKDCAACNTFMTDLSLIAQYDPSHFKVIYSYVTPVLFDFGF